MKSINEHLDDLVTIKKIMDKSTRFVSLSGLSGVFAGITAVAGFGYAITLLPISGDQEIIKNLTIAAILVLVTAISGAVVLSYRKALKQGQKIWTPVSKRLLVSISIPLLTGGILIMILLSHGLYDLIVPTMLIFYGLALVSAEKFTYSELFYLGILEIICGLVTAVIPGIGLYTWVAGFGLLHIIYGLLMYRKYDK